MPESAFWFALIVIGAAFIFGITFVWFVFNVKMPKWFPKGLNPGKPLMECTHDNRYWIDYNANRSKFKSDAAWKKDYLERRVPKKTLF